MRRSRPGAGLRLHPAPGLPAARLQPAHDILQRLLAGLGQGGIARPGAGVQVGMRLHNGADAGHARARVLPAGATRSTP